MEEKVRYQGVGREDSLGKETPRTVPMQIMRKRPGRIVVGEPVESVNGANRLVHAFFRLERRGDVDLCSLLLLLLLLLLRLVVLLAIEAVEQDTALLVFCVLVVLCLAFDISWRRGVVMLLLLGDAMAGMVTSSVRVVSSAVVVVVVSCF